MPYLDAIQQLHTEGHNRKGQATLFYTIAGRLLLIGNRFSFITGLLMSAAILMMTNPMIAIAKDGKNQATIAKDARLGGDSARTRFVADLSAATDYRIFTLSDPYRIIIDLPDVSFKLPQGLGSIGKGLVSAFRYGLFAPGKSRIVIDVIGPVHVEQSFVLKATKKQSAKLVVDIVPTDVANFKRLQNELSKKRKKAKGAVKKASLDKTIQKLTKTDRPKGRPRIVIDPGHGGLDPGASGRGGSKEKNIVLNFAKILKKQIQRLNKYDVKLTRSVDVFVPLAKRVEIAEDYNAALFISIHADSISKKLASRTRGASIYTLSKEGSDKEAQALAAKENKSDILAGLDLPEDSNEVGGILLDLTMRETKNQSLKFSDFAVGRMQTKTKFTQNKTRSANFVVLRSAFVPSVLIELGFISNRKDEQLLRSKKWQLSLSKALAKAVDKFLEGS